MRGHKRKLPEESLALDSIAGDICALQELKGFYDRLQRSSVKIDPKKSKREKIEDYISPDRKSILLS